ncbi:hypothetical protein [Rhodococcus pyridinivorans]|uniref:hypothetical protein n=1 Tax=Rhodococcus pyridinivorans TaxID=103816 RepID=UPI00110E5D08|nr:hypothetical protein [Rhodococcus pyridinivorans]
MTTAPGRDGREFDEKSIPDPRRTITLDNGTTAAECITSEGTITLWLLNTCDVEPVDQYGCACWHCVPHEYPGATLPPDIQRRLDRAMQPRCGRPRRDGAPCRTPVARPGLSCHNHAHTPTPEGTDRT